MELKHYIHFLMNISYIQRHMINQGILFN